MKKVLVEFLGKNGAGTTFTLEVARAIEQNGYIVYVLLSGQVLNRAQWDELSKENPHIVLKYINTGNKKTFIFRTIGFLWRISNELKELKNIEFEFAFRTFPHPWMEFVEKKLSITKVYYILHDPIPHTGTEWYRKYIAKRNVDTATDIILLSSKFKDVVKKNYSIKDKKIHIMRHGLLSINKNINEENELKLDDLKSNVINFLFFGRIDKYKGLHVLAKAFGRICDYSKCGLVIAGSGDFSDYQEEYRLLPQVRVINRYITDSEMASLFSLPNTVVVLPYLDATQSGVITVAADFLCPVIASDTGALKEQLNNGKIGMFFDAGDDVQLAKIMSSFIENRSIYDEERKKMQYFKEELNWSNIIRNLLQEK